ncbi:hypothetical protein COV13_03040 [Candidatus Woesearchaeota archaeon CG10_big_fil_rev_8_21_14_0_10_32_9]|nr:MAG: hypothetical protein COV13_03040 [Candidatus Woesearchaeota archaeon CG10_big_fil_rev_8_21_14_0_10_32_9]
MPGSNKKRLNDLLRENRIEIISDVIDDDRYKLDKKLGQGTWGSVYSATDTITNDSVAVKVYDPSELAIKQALEREISENEFMISEALDPNAYRNIATRWLMYDKKKKPFIVTKKYDTFLSDILLDETVRASYKNENLSEERLLKIGLDITSSIADLHTKRKEPKVHADIKADNIGIDYSNGTETAELLDFGSATTIAYGLNKKDRKNIGFLYTRAPEVFFYENQDEPKKEISLFVDKSIRPKSQSDVWSTAALIFRMYTGEYPLEKELNKAENPEKLISEMSSADLNKIIKKGSRIIPREVRKPIKKALSYNYWERHKTGQELYDELKPVYERAIDPNTPFKDFLKWTKRLTLPFAAVTLMLYGISVHEPTDIKLPNITQGQMVLTNAIPKDKVFFNKEDSTKYTPDNAGAFTLGNNTFNTLSQNPYVVYLMRQYRLAIDTSPERIRNIVTDYQMDAWLQTTRPDERQFAEPIKPIAHAIELAMNNNYLDGQIDLEDLCVEAVLGPKRLKDAKEIIGSKDYFAYKNAKYRNGTYVLPTRERGFIDTWLKNVQLTNYEFPSTTKVDSTQD